MSSLDSTWITSLSCSPSSGDAVAAYALPQWLRFIFLSPCPQRALLSAVDVLLLFTLLVFAITKLYSRFTSSNRTHSEEINKPLISNTRALNTRTTLWFKLTLIATIVLTVLYTVGCILVFSSSNVESPWKQLDGLFWVVQAITQLVLVILIIHVKRFEAVVHPLSLRIYWIANFVVVALFTASGVIRLVSLEGSYFFMVDDVVSFVSLPFSLFLLCVGVKGSTGVIKSREESQLVIDNDEETKLNGYDDHGL